jgi:hypothetical protein
LGSFDAFVAKYDASGNQLWTTQFGSSGEDYALGISSDSSGNIYVTGGTTGSLPSYSNLGSFDAFVAKYDVRGNQLWVKQFGTSGEDSANGISTDSSGNIYVTGNTTGSLLGYGNLGSKDAFIAKYDASGNQLWVKQFGSSGEDSALGISTDSSGNVYVTGETAGSLPGYSNLGSKDAFVAKYDASGNQLWVKQFGSSGEDSARGISTDSSGNIYVTGVTAGSLPGYSNLGSNDAFVTKYDASGNQLWVKQFGTSGDDNATGISTNSNGNVYVTGFTDGSLPGNSNLGSNDAFVVGFDGNGNLLDTSNPLPSITLAVSPNSVTEDGTNNLVYTFTRTGPIANALTVTYGITGTADSSDYTGVTPGAGKTITFAANSATATLTLDPTADTTVEPDETAILTLASGTGYTIETSTPITATITNDDVASYGNKLTTPIIRFQNTDKPGTYLFAGEQEAASIRQNYKGFKEEGLAFQVAVNKDDPLMQPFYRFQNTTKGREGTYLFADEKEAISIRQNYKNFKEEGLAFYAYSAGVGGGTTDFARFQNKNAPGTYLFTGPSETSSVLTNFPSFMLEGSAFAAG